MQKHSLRSASFALALAIAGTSFAFVLPVPESKIPVAYAAAVDYFLKLEGVEGESSGRHAGDIDIMSFSWGVMSPRDVATGQSSGKRQHKPITVTKELDKSSPILMRSAFDSKHYPSAILIGEDESGVEFMRLSFFDVFVETWLQEGDTGGRPMESVSFNYGKIEFKYTPMDAEGKPGTPVVAGWDLKKGTKI